MYIKNKIINSSIFLLAVLSVFVTASSCEEDDVFTGAPQGPVTVLRGSITTSETDVVGSQSFPVTVSLGDNPDTPEADLLTFPVDVSVEAITIIPNSNKRTRKSFVIPAGQNSLVSTMNAPSGDATSDLPFNLSVKMYLSAIASVPDADELRGFAGKQYTIVSDTIDLGYGDTPVSAINAKKLGIYFDFKGPYSDQSSNFNNLNIVLKKNGSVMPSQSSIQGVSPVGSTTRPLYGTLSNATQYERIFFNDVEQELKVTNQTIANRDAGIYTVKAPSSNGVANDKPHGFKVGDQVKIDNINGAGGSLVVDVATVADAYTFTFNHPGASLFGVEPAFYQPKFNLIAIDWSPFLAYSANDVVVVNNITYYAKLNIAANPAGNMLPADDTANWTQTKKIIDWDNDPAAINPPVWVAGSTSASQTYFVNDIRKFNNVVYVCTKQHTIAAATPTPATDATRWTPAIVEYKSDVSNYTSTDTYTIEVYAKTLGGVSTGAAPTDVPYRFSVRFPDEISKVYSGTFTGMTIGSATNAIPKLQIVRTTTQGASTYLVTPL